MERSKAEEAVKLIDRLKSLGDMEYRLMDPQHKLKIYLADEWDEEIYEVESKGLRQGIVKVVAAEVRRIEEELEKL